MKGVKRNNAVGVKGRSGRKSKAEEFKAIIERVKEEVTNDALLALSRKVVFSAIDQMPEVMTAKDLALPVVLKGMVEKKELSGGIKVEGIEMIKPDDFKDTSDKKAI